MGPSRPLSADEDTNWRDHRNKPLTETGNGNSTWRTIQSKSKNRKIQGKCFEDETGENCSKNDNQVAKSQLLQLDNDMSITSNNTSASTENNGKKSKNFSEKSNCISRIEATTTPASTN